jgi:hypothetical protein
MDEEAALPFIAAAADPEAARGEVPEGDVVWRPSFAVR